MTNEEAFKQLVKFKNSILMELRNVGYHPTLDNESPIEFIYIALQALEKQVPKEPAAKGLDAKTGDWTIVCPNCEARTQGARMIPNYCANCGQRIEWGDTDDTQD